MEDGEALPTSLAAERAGEPTLADAARAGDQKIAPLADEVAACELEEHRAIEATSGVVIDVLDAGIMAQPCGPGAGLEALVLPRCCLVLEQEAEPFGMFEGASLRS